MTLAELEDTVAHLDRKIDTPVLYNKVLLLQLSKVCNLNCSYCCTKGDRLTVPQPPAPIDAIVDKIKALRIKELRFVGVGETVLVPNFTEMYIEVLKHVKNITILSNVIAQPKEWWRRLLKLTPPCCMIEILYTWHPEGNNMQAGIELEEIMKKVQESRKDLNLRLIKHLILTDANVQRYIDAFDKYPGFFQELVVTNDSWEHPSKYLEKAKIIAQKCKVPESNYGFCYTHPSTRTCEKDNEAHFICLNGPGDAYCYGRKHDWEPWPDDVETLCYVKDLAPCAKP